MGFGERSVNTKSSKQTSRVKTLIQSHTFLTRELDLRMAFFCAATVEFQLLDIL